jgi:hypothetical protein
VDDQKVKGELVDSKKGIVREFIKGVTIGEI